MSSVRIATRDDDAITNPPTIDIFADAAVCFLRRSTRKENRK